MSLSVSHCYEGVSRSFNRAKKKKRPKQIFRIQNGYGDLETWSDKKDVTFLDPR